MTFIDFYKKFWHVKKRMRLLFQNEIVLKSIRNSLTSFPNSFKHQSSQYLRIWSRQCECLITYKLYKRRIFCLYAKLWEEYVFKDFLNRMKRQMNRYRVECIFSAVGLSAYNWEVNRISDENVMKYKNELEYINALREKTICCKNCSEKNNSSQIKTCECYAKDDVLRSYDDWVPFIEQKDLIVWRRLHSSGYYEYKVYGSYNDVTAVDFLNVQIDTDYRKNWDNTAISLEVIERDPNVSTNSDVVYWEMLWPRLFANRDYVFNRRFVVDEQKKTIIIVSKATDHPLYPSRTEKHRVQDYWSYMVIKPYQELNQPGIEFGLTYFDNPGVNIPAAVTTWVAIQAMPEFLAKLREATREYKDYCKNEGNDYKYNIFNNDNNNMNEKSEDVIHLNNDAIFVDIVPEIQNSPKLNEYKTTENEKVLFVIDKNLRTNEYVSDVEVIVSPSPTIQADLETHSYWKYLHPTYYFC